MIVGYVIVCCVYGGCCMVAKYAQDMYMYVQCKDIRTVQSVQVLVNDFSYVWLRTLR